MKISTLMEYLEDAKEKHGDVEIVSQHPDGGFQWFKTTITTEVHADYATRLIIQSKDRSKNTNKKEIQNGKDS